MDDHDWLAEQFEQHRSHLRAVAYRMLGSSAEADDAVQEAWLRLSRTGPGEAGNLGGWLTTVVGRVSLDMLRWRRSRREDPLGPELPEELHGARDGADPEREVLLADAVGPALLVVLETLAPAERLASRARRRVQGAPAAPGADPGRQRAVVDAFLAASRDGDFDALVALLDPDVVLRADPAAVRAGAEAEVRGARAVAGTFSGRARFARPALVDGAAGAVWAPGGRPRVAFRFTITGGRITGIDLVADPERLGRLAITPGG